MIVGETFGASVADAAVVFTIVILNTIVANVGSTYSVFTLSIGVTLDTLSCVNVARARGTVRVGQAFNT
jgi:hypothetical protein